MTLFENQNILLISPEAWGQNLVSKHHYAIELSNKNKVYFLNPPDNLLAIREVRPNLKVINYKPKFRGLGRLPSFINQWLIKWEILALEKELGATFDILWNFDSSRFFNLKLLPNKLKICHIVDMAENIQRSKLASTADYCFCTSNFLLNELKIANKNSFKIHHGHHTHDQIKPIEEDFSSAIQIGYVGNLARTHIDWSAIFKIIINHPELIFNFIGNYKKSNLSKKEIDPKVLSQLKAFENVRLLGPKEGDLLPSYLEKMDILLCCYKIENEEDIKQHSNLHKTMEYLGSGKVIVSSYSDEYKEKSELFEMVSPNEDIVVKFDHVVNNITYFNSKEKKNERIGFALSNSYSNQIEKINLIIAENTTRK